MIDICVKSMSRQDSKRYHSATRVMGNLFKVFKGDDAVIFERAIAVGYFNSLLEAFECV